MADSSAGPRKVPGGPGICVFLEDKDSKSHGHCVPGHGSQFAAAFIGQSIQFEHQNNEGGHRILNTEKVRIHETQLVMNR